MVKKSETVLNAIMASTLGIMTILVFTNVVLRYIFNSGIPWGEEFSRILFIWMVFIGAISVFKDNGHIKIDILLNHIPAAGKKILLFIGNILMLFVLGLFLDGSWKLTLSNYINKYPASGIPLSFVYIVGVIASLGMGAIILVNTFWLFMNRDFSQKSSHAIESKADLFVEKTK